MTGFGFVDEARVPQVSAVSSLETPLLAFEVIEKPAEIEDLWRTFQDEGICSPYQRFDWVQSFTNELAERYRFSARTLLLRGASNRPLMLLPLALYRRRGVTIASFVGGKQANFNLPITAKGFSSTFSAADLEALLRDIGRRALAVDAFVFSNQPLSWRGQRNPLATFDGSPSPSHGFKLSLSRNAEQTLARAFSGEARKKMRKKLRLLSDLGEPRFWQARTPQEVDTILEAFFRQKEARFRAAGIQNPFESGIQDFLRRACLAGLDGGHPAVDLYALAAGERVVATFGGAGDRWRFCGMFNSFDTGEDVARHSPGELLLAHVIQVQCGLGREIFDLGVGEAAYKTALCDETEELLDVFLPVTARGKVYIMAIKQLVAGKRLIKQTGWAWGAVNLLRRLKARATRS